MHTDEPGCAELALLLQADIDGELDAAEAVVVARHLADCEACRLRQQKLLTLRDAMRTAPLREAPSAEFRAALRQRLRAHADTVGILRPPPQHPWRPWQAIIGFVAGGALAASALLFTLPAAPQFEEQVLAGHVRSLQETHLLDVASTDQHTVKPWFNGRIDFVPPVRDFAEQGYPLTGGRLDYLAGRTVAALVYRHAQHPINLFVWPAAGDTERSSEPRCGHRDGYQLCHWEQDGMNLWAVSDMNDEAMQEFVSLWQGR